MSNFNLGSILSVTSCLICTQETCILNLPQKRKHIYATKSTLKAKPAVSQYKWLQHSICTFENSFLIKLFFFFSERFKNSTFFFFSNKLGLMKSTQQCANYGFYPRSFLFLLLCLLLHKKNIYIYISNLYFHSIWGTLINIYCYYWEEIVEWYTWWQCTKDENSLGTGFSFLRANKISKLM